MDRPDPGEHVRIYSQELENDHGSVPCSAGTTDTTWSRGRHPWQAQVPRTWRTEVSERQEHQGERSREEQEQLLSENLEVEGSEGVRGHITENKGPEKQNGEKA